MNTITQEILRDLLHYEPDTGHFRWASEPLKGQVAGRLHHGYVRISLGRFGKIYAHRLAWLYMKGEMPTKQVDHMDLDRSNNAWSNLRLATPGQNRANTRRTIRNISGAKGVYRFNGSYRAKIRVRGKAFHLGDYNTLEEAAAAYAGAALVAFGEYARVS